MSATESAISSEELQLAQRNSGMPLEALQWPITPPGLHYLLIHYDIPQVDAGAWRLDVGGCVERPVSLSLDDVQRRERVSIPVTMECAGNGRARMDPRPISQPWLSETVVTVVWSVATLAPLLREPAPPGGAGEVPITALSRAVDGGVPQ